jgi:hypothetical protein
MNVSPDALKRWPVVGGVLTLMLLAALAVAYWQNYQDRQRYLTSRNFRLLSVLASQTGNLLDTRARIVRDGLANAPIAGLQASATWVPKSVKDLNDPFLANAGIEGPDAPTDGLRRALAGSSASIVGEGAALRLRLHPQGAPPTASTLPVVTVRITARGALGDIFREKLGQGAFDTLALATPDGAVVYAAGRRADELSAMSLATLLPAPADPEASRDFRPLAGTIAEQPVQIAGVDYRMFVQHCCRVEHQNTGGMPLSINLALVGLTQTDALNTASLAISPVLVLGGIAFVLAALVGWSFLKIALAGPQQRVTKLDVLMLAASSVFGLALGTILLLTIAAYARLGADVDQQLAQLAKRLNQSLTSEIDDAYSQTTAMAEHLRVVCANETEAELGEPCRTAITALARDVADEGNPYPDFVSFTLADHEGFQRVKVGGDAKTSRRIVVADREYFKQAKEGRAWPLRQCPMGCVLESHWSWITGNPQVALSMPIGIPGLPVAVLAFPMRPLLAPALPAGFAFAVINDAGQVQFHSDRQRNVHENLLVETDQNARLQSIINAHRAGTVNTPYWGRPYRAYVMPAVVPGWSIITLHDKQHTRSLVLEWTSVSLLLQGVFMALWMIGVGVALMMGTSWLWPDPLRRPWYPVLSALYVGGLLLWALLAYRAGPVTAATLGVALPVVLWLVTCAVLYRQLPEGEKAKSLSHLYRDYRLAGALLLVATAVVPAASFFALSYDLHIEGFLKSRQIALARSIDTIARCGEEWSGDEPQTMRARYDRVFYNSAVGCVEGDETPMPAAAEAAESTPAGNDDADGEPWGLHSLLEDYLPYYTSASVETRELLHRRANDNSWASTRTAEGGMAVDVAARVPGYRLTLQSPVPPPLGIRSQAEGARVVWTAVLSLVLLIAGIIACVHWVMCYLLRHVLLADIVEPARPKLPVEPSVGQHMLVICDDPAAQAKLLTENSDAAIFGLTSILTADNPGVAWRQARVALGSASTVVPLVIPDVSDGMDDLSLLFKKLALVDQLMGDLEQTVVLIVKYPAYVLAAAAKDAARGRVEPDRWPKLIGRLTVIDIRTSSQSTSELSGAAATVTWRERLAQLWAAWTKPQPGDWQTTLISEEAGRNKKLRRICDELQRTLAFQSRGLTCEQLIEELADRAAPYYLRVWQSCDTDERVVLAHVAQHGLVSAASRRVVRRLLGKGLLRKDPNLRLMNRSFQRFVLTAECRKEVAALEQMAEPSVWDRLRVPLGLTSLATLLFLVITQREAFDATVAMAAGVTTAVPTLMRLTSFLTQLGTRSNTPPTANA